MSLSETFILENEFRAQSHLRGKRVHRSTFRGGNGLGSQKGPETNL